MLFFCQTAYAAESVQPDPDATGSISVTMRDEQQQAVGGGTLLLYSVAELSLDDGNPAWVYTQPFAQCGVALEGISEAPFAAALEQYAQDNHLTGLEAKLSASGTVTFSQLPAGLYLITQGESAEGYYPINPFVVSLPFQEESGDWIYTVDATPKMEVSSTPSNPSVPPPTTDSKLPQTGQLNWPIPLLASAGVLLFLVGWKMVFRPGKKGGHGA